MRELREKRLGPNGEKSPAQIKENRAIKEASQSEAKKKALQLKKNAATTNGPQRNGTGGHSGKNNPVKADGKLIFSKFDLGISERDKKRKRHTGSLAMPSDPKQALERLQSRQAKLVKLAASNPEKAKEKKESYEWKKVAALAAGEKVKDNDKLFKKALKRKEAQKQKSAKAWKDRIDKEKISKKQAIKKRAENIANRKKRPGFEGKAFSSKKSK